MIRLAFRNLFQNKIRLVISVGGVALALLLILTLDAIFNGVEKRLTVYIDNSDADIFVAQLGVRNLHMAASSLPASAQSKVEAVEGVASVTPILYLSNMVVAGDERNLAYIIGLPEDANAGGPWLVSEGRKLPGKDEAIIDRDIAEKSGITLGDSVKILGKEFTVVGLSEETSSLVNSIAFILIDDFAALRNGNDSVSFLLVKVQTGETPASVAKRIETEAGELTAETSQSFAMQERKVIKDMSTDVITIMNLIGFLIGLAVMALTIYTATLSRRKEYGVLKALGTRNLHLYQVVLVQALLSVTLGFAAGLIITLLLSELISFLGLSMLLEVSWISLIKVAGLSLLIAAIAAIMPIRQISGLDPAMVFRG